MVNKSDTHTHFYNPHRPEGCPWPSPEEELLYRTVLPEHFREVASPHGVTGTVVVEAACWVEDNQWILDMADDDPTIVGLIGRCEVGTPEFKRQIERFAKHHYGVEAEHSNLDEEKARKAFAALFIPRWNGGKLSNMFYNDGRVFNYGEDEETGEPVLWEQHWNDENGRFFFFNKNTGESSWQNPVLVDKESDKLRAAFALFDTDQSGELDQKELTLLLLCFIIFILVRASREE